MKKSVVCKIVAEILAKSLETEAKLEKLRRNVKISKSDFDVFNNGAVSLIDLKRYLAAHSIVLKEQEVYDHLHFGRQQPQS